MRRVLLIAVVATVLVLALSVPALAAASDPPNAYGQDIKVAAQVWKDPAYAVDDPFGQRLSGLVALINDGVFGWKNHGEAVADVKSGDFVPPPYPPAE